MTRLFGYKLSAEDGSESRWIFVNSSNAPISIALTQKNGAWQIYEGYSEGIQPWAAPRELKVETCVFDFDPVSMSFTREE